MRLVVPARKRWAFALAIVGWLSFGAELLSQPLTVGEDEGVTGFGLALRKLSKTASILYVTAHPDDENNALLVRLSRGEGYRVGLLALTRGEGGQNEIGSELEDDLALLRTEELAAVHRFDGVRQFFTRARDFGYSFSVEETFQKWGREEILSDIVRVIRLFRPTVVVTLNPSGPGGGQHHQASAQLALEACRLAGDATRFPEQIREGLRPWRPFRVFHAPGAGMGQGGFAGDVVVSVGDFDPLLGESWAEFGARARSRHLSQGMLTPADPEPLSSHFVLATSRVESTRLQNGFFDQIPVGLEALEQFDPALGSAVTLLDGYVSWAQQSYERSEWSEAVKAVGTALGYVRQVRASTLQPDAVFLLDRKEEDLVGALERGVFLYADALLENSEDSYVTPGEEIRVGVRCLARASVPFNVEDIRLETPDGWHVLPENVGGNSRQFVVQVPEGAELSGPYWEKEEGADRNRPREGFAGIEPEASPPVTAVLRYRVFDVSATVRRPLQYRWVDSRTGEERRRAVEVVPRIGVQAEPPLIVRPQASLKPVELEVRVTNWTRRRSPVSVRLEGAAGWTVQPKEYRMELGPEGGSRLCVFQLSPSAQGGSAESGLRATVQEGDRSYSVGIREIVYPHIEGRVRPVQASVELKGIPVEIPEGMRIGYVEGVGDSVGRFTERLGIDVTYLGERDLAERDLSAFDAVVIGIRALLVRRDLVDNFGRLLEYVYQGGNLVVQYHKYEFLTGKFSPYPVSIRQPHDRVTVEDSPVTLLLPEHPLLQRPNRIREEDWGGWVQERGLYFLGEWDEHFQPLLELRDPWPYNSEPKRGALLVAPYGRGSYIYTGLAFFRQLPAGVPGAYRLWVNLLSYGRTRRVP